MKRNSEQKANKEHALAYRLAAGDSRTQAARLVGYSPVTVSKKLSEKAFLKLVDTLRSEMISEASGRVTHFAKSAAETLHQLESSKEQDPKIRVAAAKAILDSLVRVGEYAALLTRVQKLEEALELRGSE